ncbi:hypothetical protein [Spirosoma daeguense]
MKQRFLVLILLALNVSCGRDCESEADTYRPKKCTIKIASRKFSGQWFQIEGTNVENGNRTMYAHTGNWYQLFEKHIEIGDTVIKQPNELVFSIHKKDTVLVFPFECKGRIIE